MSNQSFCVVTRSTEQAQEITKNKEILSPSINYTVSTAPSKSVENTRVKNYKEDISTRSTKSTPPTDDDIYKGYVEKTP